MRNKSVLISIQPQWCKLIANGEKTFEVRKSRPKLETPFKVHIYCTQGDALALPCLNVPKYTIHRMNNGTLNGRRMTAEERAKSDYAYANGKVIGEFVCDTIECVGIPYPAYSSELDRQYIEKSCINYSTLHEYCGHGNLYFWHISNLRIYDKPKELTDFKPWNRECLYEHLGFAIPKCEECLECKVKKPPQSWCYINEEE